MDCHDNDPHYWRPPNRTCVIPSCHNTDVKNPDKKFIPVRKELKENWCKLIDRNCPNRSLFCCEDHINLEEDLENYQEFMSGGKPKLKLNSIPKNIPQKVVKTRRKTTLLEEDLENYQEFMSGGKPKHKLHSIPKNIPQKVVKTRKTTLVDVAVQCENKVFKSKAVMVKPKTAEKSTNFRARQTKVKEMPSLVSRLPDSEESPSTSVSLFGSCNFESSSTTGILAKEIHGRQHLMNVIENKPKLFLGIPKHFWWIIDYLARQYNTPSFHIILTLFKIKNNDSFARMSEQFQISKSTIRIAFEKNINMLATFFQNFIYLPDRLEIKKNLPLVFKIRYSNVQCIIDCFEIQIEKPSDPIQQAQTWSQYKSCNTIKYLIGCTPAGLVTFISKGFGGRISDKSITEKSNFVDILPPNATIMADRGFKEIESLLATKNVKLLRPPSVYCNRNLSKKEVIETKVIASLRIHIERVIRKVREFHMLKPHSVINNKHIKYLDEIVIIACGLINLQDPIIKEC